VFARIKRISKYLRRIPRLEISTEQFFLPCPLPPPCTVLNKYGYPCTAQSSSALRHETYHKSRKTDKLKSMCIFKLNTCIAGLVSQYQVSVTVTTAGQRKPPHSQIQRNYQWLKLWWQLYAYVTSGLGMLGWAFDAHRIEVNVGACSKLCRLDAVHCCQRSCRINPGTLNEIP